MPAESANAAGVTPLMRSACHGAAETTRLLLERGANLEAKDAEGRGALHHAAMMGAVPNDSLPPLLEGGLSVEAQDGKGSTPLLLSIAHGHVGFAELLLETHGATASGGAQIALHLAAATHQVGTEPRRFLLLASRAVANTICRRCLRWT